MGQGLSNPCHICGDLEFQHEDKLKKNLEAQLLDAAKNGDHESIWSILSEAADANVDLFVSTPSTSLTTTPAHLAASKGNSRALHALWYGNFPVDMPIHDGRTPLFFAISGPREHAAAAVKVLIENAHVNVNHVAQHGETPLFAACLQGNVEVINLLVAAGANVNCATHHGTTPLMVASERGDNEVVQTLLQLKADITRTSTSGSTALFAAAELGHTLTADLLLHAGAELDVRRRGGATPLLVACSQGWAHMVELLLCEWDADPNISCADGRTPLHEVLEWAAVGRDALVAAFGNSVTAINHDTKPLAISTQHKPTTPKFMSLNHSSGLSFESPFPTSKTKSLPHMKYRDRVILHQESPRNSRRPRAMSLPMVKEEEFGEDDDDDDDEYFGLTSNKDKSSNEPVEKKAATIRVPSIALRIIQLLLDHSADTEATLVGSGETPLHTACRHGLVGCVRLLAPCSNVRLTAGDDGSTPLHLAAKFGHTEIIEILLKESSSQAASLENKTSSMSPPSSLLSPVPFIDVRDAGGEAPLHLAARFGEVGAIRRLVEAGAEVDVRRQFDQATPLTVAALFNRIAAAKLLIQFGASLRPIKLSNYGNHNCHGSDVSTNIMIPVDNATAAEEQHDQSWSCSPAEQAMAWGHTELAEHLRQVEKAGYLAWLAAPRIELIKLRILANTGRAWFIPNGGCDYTEVAVEVGKKSRRGLVRRRSKRRSWTQSEVEVALCFILGTGTATQLHAPDNVFAIIASYWWP